jgi:hypothetical protein
MLYTLEKRFDKVKFEEGIVALLGENSFYTPIGEERIFFTGDEGYEECVKAGIVHPIPGGVIIFNGIRSINWPYSHEFRFDPRWKISRPIILIKNIQVLSSFEKADFDGIQDGEDAFIFLHDVSRESEIKIEGGYIKWKFDEILEIKIYDKIIYKK